MATAALIFGLAGAFAFAAVVPSVGAPPSVDAPQENTWSPAVAAVATAPFSGRLATLGVSSARSGGGGATYDAPAPRQALRRGRRWDTHLHARPGKGQFRRFFRMKVTAYTPINTRMEGGRYTVTRRDGRGAHGVAVDPDLIPLGSRLWIPGYGHALADDIGGRIQGHRVDLRMQNARTMRAWGVRKTRVYVLDEPQPDR